jgi:hypothetical protein
MSDLVGPLVGFAVGAEAADETTSRHVDAYALSWCHVRACCGHRGGCLAVVANAVMKTSRGSC